MNVSFASHDLVTCFEDIREAERRWGKDVARRYIQRITLMYEVDRFSDLFSIRTLRMHPLSGKRSGEYASTLTLRWRLIVAPSTDQRSVHVLEVTNHYGD